MTIDKVAKTLRCFLSLDRISRLTCDSCDRQRFCDELTELIKKHRDK